MGKHEDELFNLGISSSKAAKTPTLNDWRLDRYQLCTEWGNFITCDEDSNCAMAIHGRVLASNIAPVLRPPIYHRYVSPTTIEAVVHMTSTVGKKCVQLQGQVQWVEKGW